MRRSIAAVALLTLLAIVGRPTPVAAQGRGTPVTCIVTISTAVILTAVGGDCAAQPGRTLWITDIAFSTNASGIAADTFNTLKYGTGTVCATGTTVFWGALTIAATQAVVIQSFVTPIRLPANVDVCWINSTAGSKFLVITGFYTS